MNTSEYTDLNNNFLNDNDLTINNSSSSSSSSSTKYMMRCQFSKDCQIVENDYSLDCIENKCVCKNETFSWNGTKCSNLFFYKFLYTQQVPFTQHVTFGDIKNYFADRLRVNTHLDSAAKARPAVRLTCHVMSRPSLEHPNRVKRQGRIRKD